MAYSPLRTPSSLRTNQRPVSRSRDHSPPIRGWSSYSGSGSLDTEGSYDEERPLSVSDIDCLHGTNQMYHSLYLQRLTIIESPSSEFDQVMMMMIMMMIMMMMMMMMMILMMMLMTRTWRRRQNWPSSPDSLPSPQIQRWVTASYTCDSLAALEFFSWVPRSSYDSPAEPEETILQKKFKSQSYL